MSIAEGDRISLVQTAAHSAIAEPSVRVSAALGIKSWLIEVGEVKLLNVWFAPAVAVAQAGTPPTTVKH